MFAWQTTWNLEENLGEFLIFLGVYVRIIGSCRQVHISEATFHCLNGAYEVEPGNGQDRDSYLKDNNVTTYLIKQCEPMPPRRRLASRPRQEIAVFKLN